MDKKKCCVDRCHGVGTAELRVTSTALPSLIIDTAPLINRFTSSPQHCEYQYSKSDLYTPRSGSFATSNFTT